ncbi:hypothetical protein M2281_004397 [Mesorhizobium soli]|nr:hypothetical protein [Mesorhizobium soli]MDH6233784.1 hypothetical protein [Mesorhizobium soli]
MKDHGGGPHSGAEADDDDFFRVVMGQGPAAKDKTGKGDCRAVGPGNAGCASGFRRRTDQQGCPDQAEEQREGNIPRDALAKEQGSQQPDQDRGGADRDERGQRHADFGNGPEVADLTKRHGQSGNYCKNAGYASVKPEAL